MRDVPARFERFFIDRVEDISSNGITLFYYSIKNNIEILIFYFFAITGLRFFTTLASSEELTDTELATRSNEY